MTEKQAIKILKEEKSWESDDRKIDAFIMGIEALEEIQQYRAIGTVEEFKVLKDKSVAKKIIAKKKTKSYLGTDYYCPTCNKRQLTAYMLSKGDDYCKDCGQKLDWSE